jgi:hypothetical protein
VSWGVESLVESFDRHFLTPKYVYYLDGKKATLLSISNDTSMVAYEKSRGD